MLSDRTRPRYIPTKKVMDLTWVTLLILMNRIVTLLPLKNIRGRSNRYLALPPLGATIERKIHYRVGYSSTPTVEIPAE